ncbi:MAG: MFS transporter [Actinomyces sp.]|nr:MAG: MFS transporter [Actinomyces sp.]
MPAGRHDADPPPSPWRVYLLVAGAVLLATVNFSVVFVAFGDIRDTFATSGSAVSWALTAFSITIAALLVPGGWLADRVGRAPTFLVGFGLFIAGSALVAVAPTVPVLVGARVVQAAGLALESPAALAIVLDAFPARRRSTAVGAMGAVGGVAAAIGPVVGGALVDTIGWRRTFALNVPLGLAVLVAVRGRLPAGRAPVAAGPPDLVGAGALVVGVGALALGIVQSDDWGVGDPRTLAALAVAVVALTGLVHRSRRHAEPILHLPLFELHDFRLGTALSFVLAGNFGGTFLAFITLLTDAWGLSLFRAGLAVAVIPAIGGPLSVVAGRLADQRGHRAVIVPGAVCMGAAGVWMFASVSSTRELTGLWLPVAVLYATGVGLAHAACQAAALAEAPSGRLGVASAMSRIAQEIGNTISVAIVIAVLAHAADPVAGTRGVMVLLVGISAASIPLGLALRSRGAGPVTGTRPAPGG